MLILQLLFFRDRQHFHDVAPLQTQCLKNKIGEKSAILFESNCKILEDVPKSCENQKMYAKFRQYFEVQLNDF